MERAADAELRQALLRGEYCFVLTARQTGKSSLMLRTAAALRQRDIRTAVLDLSALGQNLTPEQWYQGILTLLGQQLGLEEEVEAFWLEHRPVAPLQRWLLALERVVLPGGQGSGLRVPGAERAGPDLVLFIDEVDAVRSLPFSTDEFFAGVRHCYNRRAEAPRFTGLTFCLLGVAAPTDLIRDARTTPFNIGRRIELSDFSEAEAAVLQPGLAAEPALARRRLRRVLHWTGGHPYLTQRLCEAVAQKNGHRGGERLVDACCRRLFLADGAEVREENLLFVRERLLRGGEDVAALLDLYAQIRAGRPIPDDELDPLASALRLSGIARLQGGRLRVRNRIYARVFNPGWVRVHLPGAELRRQRLAFRRGLLRAGTLGAMAVAVVSLLAALAASNEQKAMRAVREARQSLAERDEALRAMEAAHEAAEGEREKNRLQLVRLYISEGGRAASAGDPLTALLYFIRAFELDAGRPDREEDHRLRIASTLRECPRLLAVREINRNVSAVYSPDGRRVLFTLADGETAVLASGDTLAPVAPIKTRRMAGNPTPPMAFSPDGRTLAIAEAGNFVRFRRVDSGKPYGPALPHPDWPTAVAYSPDGRQLATGCSDGLLRFFDTRTGRSARAPLKDPSGPVLSASFSPEGREVLTTAAAPGQKGVTRRWSLESGRSTHIPNANGAFFLAPSGAIVTLNAAGVRVLEPDTRPRSEIPALSALGLQVGAGGRHLAFLGGGHVVVWDVVASRLVQRFAPATEQSLFTYLPDGLSFISLDVEGAVRLWRPEESGRGHVVTHLPGFVQSATPSPDCRRMLVVHQDGLARLWGLSLAPSGDVVIRSPSGILPSLSPDARVALVAGVDGTVRLYRTDTGAVERTLRPGVPLTAMAFSGDSRQIAAAGEDRTLRRWSAVNGVRLGRGIALPEAAARLALDRAGRTAAFLTRQGRCYVIDVASGVCRAIPSRVRARDLTLDPTGTLLAMRREPEGTEIWDLRCSPPRLAIVGGEPVMPFAADGEHVLTGVGEGALHVATARGAEHRGAELMAGGAVFGAAFSPDGRLVVTAGKDGARIWDWRTGRQVVQPLRHRISLLDAAFSADGTKVLTATWSGEVQVWDAGTGEPLSHPTRMGSIGPVRFSADGRMVALLHGGKEVHSWPLEPDRRDLPTLKRLASLLSGRRFNEEGEVVPLAPAEMLELWKERRAELPAPPPETDYAWVRQQAMTACASRSWDAAEAHLSVLIKKLPGDVELYGKRGEARAELGRYRAAAADFRELIRRGRKHYLPYYWLALLRLALQDEAGYHRASAAVLAEAERGAETRYREMAAWTAALGPNSPQNLRRAEALVRKLLRAGEDRPGDFHTLGALLYRQGRYGEAEDALRKALEAREGDAPVDHLLVAALVAARLGRREEAVRLRASAVRQRAEEQGANQQAGQVSWDDRLAYGLWLEELDAVIRR